MTLKDVLKKLRKERKISQKNLADYLGLTRQAVAFYELGKREPDYEILKKIADYFNVSIDYLLGRTSARELEAFTVGKNIKLIRGNLSYKEFSEAIIAATGTVIFPDDIEKYEKGEEMPSSTYIKIFAKYAGVDETFFFNGNTPESLMNEKYGDGYKGSKEKIFRNLRVKTAGLRDLADDLTEWMLNEENLEYIKLAKEIQESSIDINAIRPLIRSISNISRQKMSPNNSISGESNNS